jgi:hypothetical protein
MPPLDPGALLVSMERSGRPAAVSSAALTCLEPRRSLTRESWKDASFSRNARMPCSGFGSAGAAATASGCTSSTTTGFGFCFSTGCSASFTSSGGLISWRTGAGGLGRSLTSMRTMRSGTFATSSASGRGRFTSGNTMASSAQKSSEAASDLR